MKVARGFSVYIAGLLTMFVVGACFSPWRGDEGTVTVNLGHSGNGRTIDWPLIADDQANAEFTVTAGDGPGETQKEQFTGAKTVHFTLLPGQWNITVEARLDGVLKAVGSATVNVRAGENTPADITMEFPYEVCTVTFINNEKPVEEQPVAKGGTVDRPDKPSGNEGWYFAGWFLEGADTPFNFETAVTEDITLYAGWKEMTVDTNIYEVSFDLNYPGAPKLNGISVGEGSAIGSQNVPSFNSPSDWLIFDGWYVSAQCNENDTWDIDNDPVNGSVTLFAKWTIDIDYAELTAGLTIDENGSIVMAVKDSVKLSPELSVVTALGNLPVLLKWESSDDKVVTFDGSSVTAKGAGTALITVTASVMGRDFSASRTVNVYAVTYVVSFKLNYFPSPDAPTEQTIGEGGYATEPEQPSRAGYTFDGWAWYTTGSQSPEKWDFATNKVTQDITLYAQWTVLVTVSISITPPEINDISIIINDGTHDIPLDGKTPQNIVLDPNIPTTLTVSEPSLYTSISWNLNGYSGGGPSFTLNNIISMAPGKYSLTVEVIKVDSVVPYSQSLSIELQGP